MLFGAPPEKAITTHPAVVKAAAALVIEAGGRPVVGDSPGVGDLAATVRKCGLEAALKPLGVGLANFQDTADFERADNRVARKIALARAVGEADVIITLPKLKTHSQMNFTGALKNQFGLVLGARKAHYHYRLQDRDWLAVLMVDINRIARPALAIMDAIIGMEGEGPSGGSPRAVGAIVAGADLAAVDTVCCHLIGLDPRVVPLLAAAERTGYGRTRLEQINIVGDERWRELIVKDFRQAPEIVHILRVIPLPRILLNWIRRQWAPRPRIMTAVCIRCGACQRGCPVQPPAIDPFTDAAERVNDATCIRCYCCHEFCPVKAIRLQPSWIGRVLGT